MLRRIAKLGLAAAAMTAFNSSSFGMFVYTYTGNPFTEFDVQGSPPGTYAVSDAITGFIAFTAPLAGSLTNQVVTPVDYRFSDGIHTYTPVHTMSAPFPDFTVSTDAHGQITSWVVALVDSTTTVGTNWLVETVNAYVPEFKYQDDFASVHVCAHPAIDCPPKDFGPFISSAGASNHASPGHWAASGSPPVPEPTTSALLAGGLLASLLYRLRRSSGALRAWQ